MSEDNSPESSANESRQTKIDLRQQITNNQAAIRGLSEALMLLLVSNLEQLATANTSQREAVEGCQQAADYTHSDHNTCAGSDTMDRRSELRSCEVLTTGIMTHSNVDLSNAAHFQLSNAAHIHLNNAGHTQSSNAAHIHLNNAAYTQSIHSHE